MFYVHNLKYIYVYVIVVTFILRLKYLTFFNYNRISHEGIYKDHKIHLLNNFRANHKLSLLLRTLHPNASQVMLGMRHQPSHCGEIKAYSTVWWLRSVQSSLKLPWHSTAIATPVHPAVSIKDTREISTSLCTFPPQRAAKSNEVIL